MSMKPVSYTHLDVYKRQDICSRTSCKYRTEGLKKRLNQTAYFKTGPETSSKKEVSVFFVSDTIFSRNKHSFLTDSSRFEHIWDL